MSGTWKPPKHPTGKGNKTAAGRARFRLVQRPFQGAKLRPNAGYAYHIWSRRLARGREIAAASAQANERKMPERRQRAALRDGRAGISRATLRLTLKACKRHSLQLLSRQAPWAKWRGGVAQSDRGGPPQRRRHGGEPRRLGNKS